MMDLDNFYTLFGDFDNKSFSAMKNSLPVEPPSIPLPVYLRVLSGDLSGVTLPIIFTQTSGSKLGDLMSIGYASLYLISDRLYSHLENQDYQGWKAFPVVVYDKKGAEAGKYHGFSITGRSGEIDYTKGRRSFVEIHPGRPQKEVIIGLPMKENEWDGSDFFMPRGHWGIITSARVKESITKAGFTMIRFEKLSHVFTQVEDLELLEIPH